jgi:hypothetical protein
MAALTLRVPVEKFDAAAFAAALRRQLPTYAMPMFLRIPAEHDITGTFINRKVELKNEGFDLDRVRDPGFYYAGPEQGYVALDAIALAAIRSGAQRV